MIHVLLSLLAALLVTAAVCWVIRFIPLPPPIKQIALAICGLILLLWVLNVFGLLGPVWPVR